MSNTPLTDAVASQCVGEGSPMSYVRAIDHARQLERELNEARAQNRQLQIDAVFATSSIERWKNDAKEAHQIVDRIWLIFGSPTYAELKGRTIYELIEELKARAETAEAQLAALQAAIAPVRERMYQHDCEECVYLGSATAGGRAIDMYYHAKPETFVARYGYEGPEYTSGDTFAYGMDAGVTLARLLAVQAGLTKVTPADDALRLLEGK